MSLLDQKVSPFAMSVSAVATVPVQDKDKDKDTGQNKQKDKDQHNQSNQNNQNNQNKQNKQKAFTYIRTEQGTFICPTCGIIKQRQNSMHYHMKKHQQDPNHSCTYCNKTFLQKQTLDLHLRTKHVDLLVEDAAAKPAFSCPISGCDFQSHTKGNCVIHCLRVHFQEEITPHLHQVQDRRVYSCGHCRNEFQSTTAFYYHIKSCITFDQTTPKYRELKKLLEP